MNKLVINEGCTIHGCYIPPFELVPGKLIRIYAPNFSPANEPLGFQFASELVELFSRNKKTKGLKVALSIPYAKNYRQKFWDRNIKIETSRMYLTNKFKSTPTQADEIIHELELDANIPFSRIELTERTFLTKLLTIKGLFIKNEALSFDYYGIGPSGEDKMNRIIKQELGKGRCAIGFDNLQFLEEAEPYDCFERIIVESI